MMEPFYAGISSDHDAPKVLLNKIAAVPLGKSLDRQIAFGAVQGAIWAFQGVLKDGWLFLQNNWRHEVVTFMEIDLS